MGAGKAIFERGLKLAASEEKKRFNRTDSEFHREEDRYAYPFTKDHQNI